MPARVLNSSSAKCAPVPLPPEPKLILPGCALASVISSPMLRACTEGWTTTTIGDQAACATGVKSLRVS